MKKQWLIIPFMFMNIVAFAQNETATEGERAEGAVGYTVTKDEVLYASPNARFGISGMDEESGVKEIHISLDGAEYSKYIGPVSFEKEGEHTINYRFIDQVGNISYSQTFNIYVDATVPRILDIIYTTAPYEASGYRFVGKKTDISFKSFDDLTGIAFVEFRTNSESEWITYSTNTTFEELGITNNGLVTLEFQAVDMVSNVSPVKKSLVFVDATAPTVEVFAKKYFEKDGTRFISSREVIYAEAFDNETKVDYIQYAINEGEFQAYDPVIGIRLPESGTYEVKAKAFDVVGNESEVFTYSVTVDKLAPTGETKYIGDQESKEYTHTEVQSSASSEEVTTTTEYTTTEGTTNSESKEVPAGETAPISN